jgi:hypothetical protein
MAYNQCSRWRFLPTLEQYDANFTVDRLQFHRLSLFHVTPAQAQSPSDGSVTLFQNVRIFDGTSDRLTEPMNVLVRGNLIEKISVDPIPTDRGRHEDHRRRGQDSDAGLIDAHTHVMFCSVPMQVILFEDVGFVHITASKAAEDMCCAVHQHPRFGWSGIWLEESD